MKNRDDKLNNDAEENIPEDTKMPDDIDKLTKSISMLKRDKDMNEIK